MNPTNRALRAGGVKLLFGPVAGPTGKVVSSEGKITFPTGGRFVVPMYELTAFLDLLASLPRRSRVGGAGDAQTSSLLLLSLQLSKPIVLEPTNPARR